MKVIDTTKSDVTANDQSEKEIQNSVKPKTALQKKVNNNGLTQRMNRGISLNKSSSVHKPKFKLSAARSQKRVIYHKRKLKPAPPGKYKLLTQNNVIAKTKLLNQKKREIQHAVKFNRASLHFKRISVDRLKKLKVAASSHKYSGAVKIAGMPSSGLRKFRSMLNAPGVKEAAAAVGKPVSLAKDKILSQKADINKSGDTGTEAMKLGFQNVGYVDRGVRAVKDTAENTVDTVKNVRKLYNRFHRTVTNNAKTSLKTAKSSAKSTRRTIKTTSRTIKATTRTVRTAANSAKTAAKTAKASANAARAAARAARVTAKVAAEIAKAIAKAAKAVVKAAQKLIELIAETAPYSLIILGAIVVLLLLYVLISTIAGGIGGTITGGAGWMIDDTESNSPSDIYDNYKRFIDEAETVIDNKIEGMKNIVSGFCEPITDPDTPKRIIAYDGSTYYPPDYKDRIINPKLSQFKDNHFDDEEYAKMMATLFVLMTREKQQAEGKTENEIYDFDFTAEDFEEFIGDIAQTGTGSTSGSGNTSKWGPTYIYKEIVTESPVPCPGENCKTKTIPGCKCGCTKDEDGTKHYYCKGDHPYCPINHTKKTVKLSTAEEYYNKTIEDLYNFTDTEKVRYGIAEEMIKLLLEDKENGVI